MADEPKFYPDLPCHLAPLRPTDPAPKPGCNCLICRTLRREGDWVPVVYSQDPYFGVLVRAEEAK